MAVTIYDIAEACETSHATVSRALKNHPKVNTNTRKRILLAAEDLGYRPLHAALALKRGRTSTVCIVVPDLANPFFVEYVRAVEQGVVSQGYKLAIAEYAWDPDRERAGIEQVLERRYDGLVAFVTRFEPLKDVLNEAWEKRLPCVVAGLPPDIGSARLDGTCVDIRPAIERAVDHLVELGHREIVFIADWPPESGAGLDRLAALRSAFARHGLPYDEATAVVRTTGPELEEGYRAATELMNRQPATTAIIGVNDYLIVGVARALTEMGLGVPHDVSLVGTDNTWIARYWPVGLTSIDLKTEKHAAAALDILFDRLSSDEWDEPRRIGLDASLVIRESTGPARRGS